MGVGSHVSITLWCKFCSWGGGVQAPAVSPPSPLFCYISLLDWLIWKPFLLITHSNFSVLNFKLGIQTNYPLAQMFFFHTLTAAFPSSYGMKTICSCWVWKLSSDACLLCVKHFIIQSALLDYRFPFLILVCYIRLVYCTSTFQIVSIVLTSLVKDSFYLQLH